MLSAREILADVHFFSRTVYLVGYMDDADGRAKDILKLDNNWAGGRIRMMFAAHDQAQKTEMIKRLYKYCARGNMYAFKDNPDMYVIEFKASPGADIVYVLYKSMLDKAMLERCRLPDVATLNNLMDMLPHVRPGIGSRGVIKMKNLVRRFNEIMQKSR